MLTNYIRNTRNKEIAITTFEANVSKDVVIIAPATGVKQSFYKKFAGFLASKGITVITFDYPGIGQSLNNSIKSYTHNAADWGEKDLEAVIQYANDNYPQLNLTIIGHSIGGQLIGLAPSSVCSSKIILIAAQSGYWKFWKGNARTKMWFNWYILFPVLTRLFGYMPSKKFSSMENLPRNVARQWSNWCRSKNYLFDDVPESKRYFHQIKCPVISFSIESDVYAPKEAVHWLTKQYSASTQQVIHLHPDEFGGKTIGHFGVFSEKFEMNIWLLLLNKIKV